MKLKPFGHGGSAHDWGYDLPMLTGWLESMANDEESDVTTRGPKAKRLAKVQEAIDLLNEAIDMGQES